MPSVAQFFHTWGAMIQTIALVATLIVLAATLVVLIFYTVFTYQLRKETVRQTELQLTPYLILDYKEDLVCKNVGNSSALNVAVSTLNVFDDKTGECSI